MEVFTNEDHKVFRAYLVEEIVESIQRHLSFTLFSSGPRTECEGRPTSQNHRDSPERALNALLEYLKELDVRWSVYALRFRRLSYRHRREDN